MNRRGHDAHLYKHDGRVWVEIDQCMLASFTELEELVDGVYSFEELAEVFEQRHAQARLTLNFFTSAHHVGTRTTVSWLSPLTGTKGRERHFYFSQLTY